MRSPLRVAPEPASARTRRYRARPHPPLPSARQAAREPFQFRGFLSVIARPAVILAQYIAPCRHAKCRGKFGIEIDCAIEPLQRLADRLFGAIEYGMKTGHAPEIVVVRVKIVRGLMLGPVNFGLLDSRRNRADHAPRHLVLPLA